MREDEVLTIRVTRWEGKSKVLETEEVVCAVHPGPAVYAVTLSEITAGYWLLTEHAVEQHLQRVKLLSFQPDAAKVDLELASNTDPKRIYRFSWSARVELWTTVKKRHPHLPALEAGIAWHSKRVVSGAALKSPF